VVEIVSLPWKSLERDVELEHPGLVGSHQKAQDWVQHPGDLDGGKSTGLIS